jgi:hypothetical protein
MSTIATMADALVTALQAAGFTEAERKPLPYVDRKDCADRKCVVICRNIASDDGSRKDLDDTYELSIVIQKEVSNPHSNTVVDALLDNVQTLWALWGESGSLHATPLSGGEWIGGPTHPTGTIYEFQQLLELNLFTSVTLVRYRIEA